MTRRGKLLLIFPFACLLLHAQQEQKPAEALPEEDESYQQKEYAFNPIQASRELKVGEFYLKKGSFRAAAARFREATRWNPGFPDAYLRLGEAEEKQKDPDKAREAYNKFLELEPEGKRAAQVKRRLAALPPPVPAKVDADPTKPPSGDNPPSSN